MATRTKTRPKNSPVSPAVEAGTAMMVAGLDQVLVSAAATDLPPDWTENRPSPPLGDEYVVMYHFTDLLHLPSVLTFGIAKGDVPISPRGGYNSPHLTTDDRWTHQTWADTRGATDKTEVRLTVGVPKNDSALHHWPQLAIDEAIEEIWVRALNTVQMGEKRFTHEKMELLSRNWWIYKGRIPTEWFLKIDYRHPRKVKSGVFGVGKTN